MRGGKPPSPPTPPRPKKPPSSQCMKLLISYGGSFYDPRPSTSPAARDGKLRYGGGETRIISVERRGLNLRKLLARVSELLPGVLLPLPADPPSLCLCHQLLWSPDEGGDHACGRRAPTLVPILGDGDVARMLEEHDRLAARGKAARPRVFLCDREPPPAVRPSDSDAWPARSGDPRVRRGVSPRGAAENLPSDVRDSYYCSAGGATACGVQARNGYAPGTRYFGHPSNPNVLQSSAAGISDCGNFQKPIARKDSVQGVGDGPLLGQLLLKTPETSTSGSGMKNRENVVPWSVDYCLAETSPLVPVHNQVNKWGPALKSVHHGGTTPSSPVSRFRICRVMGTDARHHRSPYDAHSHGGHRSGLHDLGGIKQANVLEGKVCFGKLLPGLRPRSNIAKPGQARLKTYVGKPLDAGNSKQVLKERAPQPSDERKMACQLRLLDGLPSTELGRNVVDGQTDNNSSSLPTELNKFTVLYPLHVTVGKDPSRFPNLEQHVAETQILSSSNPMAHPVQYPPTVITAPHRHRNTIEDLNSLDRVAHVTQRETGCNVEASSPKLYSSSNVNVEDTKGAFMDSVSTQLDTTPRSYPIHEAAKVASNEDLSTNNSVVNSPLDLEVSIHNLSVSSSTKAGLATHCSLGCSGILDPTTSAVTESFPGRLIGPCSSQVMVMEDDNLSMQSLTGKSVRETDCKLSDGTWCISVDDAVESQLPQKISRLSSPLTAQAPLAMGNELAHCYKEQTASFTSDVEIKDNTEEQMVISPDVVSGETSAKIPSVYSQLVTQELQTIKDTDLEEIRELGSGTYGTVFYGKWKGSDVAIKRLKPNCFPGSGSAKDHMIADFWKEAHLLGLLHHPNVVAFYGVVTDGQGTSLATVTEYMVNGSLKQVLRRKDRTIDRRKRLIIAMDAAFGMEYLHEKSVVHFDLKSHNFLVNMRDPQRPVCKIGDLGLSKVKRRTLVSGGVRGTIPWMAPELLTSQSGMVTEKVDVYSFGIVMWELLTGEEPYGDMPSEKVIAGIIKGNLRPEVPSWCDPAWRSLMERCWASDPCSRPAFSEIAKELRAIAASTSIL